MLSYHVLTNNTNCSHYSWSLNDLLTKVSEFIHIKNLLEYTYDIKDHFVCIQNGLFCHSEKPGIGYYINFFNINIACKNLKK